ncbi:MAG: hypothetical protein ABI333_00400 [bacterium]
MSARTKLVCLIIAALLGSGCGGRSFGGHVSSDSGLADGGLGLPDGLPVEH